MDGDNVSQFPVKTKRPIKEFLNKSIGDTTIGDTLILHACTVVITISVASSIQIWSTQIKKFTTK